MLKNKMINFSKQTVKKIFNSIGLDIIRLSKSPAHSLLGLRNLPIKTIIDVGANTGQFARTISKVFPKADIYCFEPLSNPFKELNKWAESQNGRVKVFNMALGDSEGTAEMLSHLEHSPSSSLLGTTEICERLYPFTKKQTSIPVQLTTLDNWVKRLPHSLTPEILIKLDVQGYEDRVIRGGQEIFKIAKACILEVNLDNLYEKQPTFKDIALLLNKYGYSYAGNLDQAYADDGHVIFIDAVFLK
ncbi:FkbM family methyltransferase [Thermodesulfovibrionales bacterium]|nr:FkbM family methyltransferase [Thermodesulfovibrionales bacterium]MCL0061810.1 FkbM family methyltransferase [Thermodesulfovibrionales bacterium]